MFDHHAMRASQQWASRPAEERFTSIPAMIEALRPLREASASKVVSSRGLKAIPDGDDHKGIVIEGPTGARAAPTHWAFGQLAGLASAPAGYLRSLPSELAADCLNYGLHVARDVEEVQLLMSKTEGGLQMRAATGPGYGRIWNYDVAAQLGELVGDGVTGRYRVPGEFGKPVQVTSENTTIFASDRDMFVFLTDERDAIEVKNRRDGQSGALSRGFYVWNSEVGSTTVGIAGFLFDFVCANRIVWGMKGFSERKFRHTSAAPDRWKTQLVPWLRQMARTDLAPVDAAIKAAQQQKIDDVEAFLAKRFSGKAAAQIADAHRNDEGRPIETVWDMVTGITAAARDIPYQADRVAMEQIAGGLLEKVRVAA